jgi:hypothetical protein
MDRERKRRRTKRRYSCSEEIRKKNKHLGVGKKMDRQARKRTEKRGMHDGGRRRNAVHPLTLFCCSCFCCCQNKTKQTKDPSTINTQWHPPILLFFLFPSLIHPSPFFLLSISPNQQNVVSVSHIRTVHHNHRPLWNYRPLPRPSSSACQEG